MLFAIFAVARRARRRCCPDYPHFSDTRQQLLLHALTTPNGLRLSWRWTAPRGADASGPIHLDRCIQTDSSGLIFKRIDRCPMFGTTPYLSLSLSRQGLAKPRWALRAALAGALFKPAFQSLRWHSRRA